MSMVDISAPSGGKLTPVEFHILLALAEEARHGYGIKLDVERRTDGRIRLGSGTLYVAIQRLEREGLVMGSRRKATSGREKLRRRYFALTDTGRQALRGELTQLDRVVRYARTLDLLGDAKSIRSE